MFIRVLIYTGLIAGALVMLLLLFFRGRKKSNNWLLGVSLGCLWYGLFINNLNVTREMLNFPYLFRTANIANYLAFPFLYLYFRNSFYPGIYWRKKDWLVFIPALLYTIDMLPFFFTSADHKIEVIRQLFSDMKLFLNFSEGWIFPAGFHLVFLYLWSLFFYVLQIRLLYRNRNYDYGMGHGQNRALYYFMIIISLLFFPLIVPGLFGVVFQLSWYSLTFINIDFAITLLAVAVYLLLSPGVLYGFYPGIQLPTGKAEAKTVAEPVSPNAGKTIIQTEAPVPEQEPSFTNAGRMVSPESIEKMILVVEQYIANERPYLKTGYTIHDLSKDISLPVYHLSPIINQHFGTNFNSWLNKFRVEYFITLLEEEKNKQLTLEALAQKSGFSSRATFISAFKKEKGCTPGSWLKGNTLNEN